MKVSIFGIGHVGSVVAACLSESGHEVTAVDPEKIKVSCINEGRSPIVENGLDELIEKNVKAGRLRATTDYRDAVMETEISLICVGTPSEENGALDYKYIKEICRQLGETLKAKNDYHVVVVRSTVVPGTLKEMIRPILEGKSGKKAGPDFGLGNNPEFLREGTAVTDYFKPAQIVVGAFDHETGEQIMSLYKGIDAPRTITDVSVAESVKYVSNAWRANKVAFANEMGLILKAHGVDSHEVMNIFFQDQKINLNQNFLMPGFAFGGSCLPRDIKALRVSANDRNLQTPLLGAILDANEQQIVHAYEMIRCSGEKKIGLLGLSFKPDTDDLRESPLVSLADRLLKSGYKLKIYDPCISKARKIGGSNRNYIENGIPHISRCLVENAEEFLENTKIFVIGNATIEFSSILDRLEEGVRIIDLARLRDTPEKQKTHAGACQ